MLLQSCNRRMLHKQTIAHKKLSIVKPVSNVAKTRHQGASTKVSSNRFILCMSILATQSCTWTDRLRIKGHNYQKLYFFTREATKPEAFLGFERLTDGAYLTRKNIRRRIFGELLFLIIGMELPCSPNLSTLFIYKGWRLLCTHTRISYHSTNSKYVNICSVWGFSYFI